MAETLFKPRCPSDQLRTLKLTAPSDATAGDLLSLSSGMVVVAVEDTLTGASAVGCYEASKMILQKDTAVTGSAMAVGDPVYMSDSTDKATGEAATGNVQIGICLEAASDAASEVLADFRGLWPTAD